MLERLSLLLAKTCDFLVGILMVVMTAVVILGVFYRYILGDSLTWSEELARYLMIWMCFLAASVLVREQGHIGISLLRDFLKPAAQKALFVLSDVAALIFCSLWFFVSVEAYDLVRYDISSGLNIPLGWVFLSQPVCAALMFIQALNLLARRFFPIHDSKGHEGENV